MADFESPSPAPDPDEDSTQGIVDDLTQEIKLLFIEQEAVNYMKDSWIMRRQLVHENGDLESVVIILRGKSIQEPVQYIIMAGNHRAMSIFPALERKSLTLEDANFFRQKFEHFKNPHQPSNPT